MNTWFAFTLLVACWPQGHAHPSDDLEDHFNQLAVLIEANEETYLQSNASNMEMNNEQHDLSMAAIETATLGQLDQLSLKVCSCFAKQKPKPQPQIASEYQHSRL